MRASVKSAISTLGMGVPLFLGSPTTHAGSNDIAFGDADQHFFNLGLEASTLTRLEGNGWQPSVGIRTSLVGLWIQSAGFIGFPEPPPWWGFYGTARYDFGPERWRTSVGAGGGIAVGGLEFGAVAQQNGASWSPGVEAAALLTVGYGGLFVRNTWTLDTGFSLELGIRGNFPVWAKGRRAKRIERAEWLSLKETATHRLNGLQIRDLQVHRPPPPPNVSDVPCFYRFPTGLPRSFGPLHAESIAARMDDWELSCADLSAEYNDRALWVLGEGPEPDNIRHSRAHTVQQWLIKEAERAATQEVLAGQTDAEGQTPTAKALGARAVEQLLDARNFQIGPMLDDERPVGALTLELLSDHSGSYVLKIYSKPKGCPLMAQLTLKTLGSLVANEPQVVQLEVPPPDLTQYITKMRQQRIPTSCADAWGTPWLEDSVRWDTVIELDQGTPEEPIRRVIKQWSTYDYGCVTTARLAGENTGKICVLMESGKLP